MTEKRFLSYEPQDQLDCGSGIYDNENPVRDLDIGEVLDLLNKFNDEIQSYDCIETSDDDCVDDPKMKIIFETEESFHRHSLFRRIQEEVAISEDMYLYVFFNMGSIILDIDDPQNHIYCNNSFSEIYDNHKKEFTFIKNDEIKGFILEFKEKPEEGEEE